MTKPYEIKFVRGPVSLAIGTRLDDAIRTAHADTTLPAGMVFAAIVKRGLDSAARYPLRFHEIVRAV